MEVVRQVYERSADAASRAVNLSLILRSSVIGWQICERKQNGADRAEYGDRLLDRLTYALRQREIADTSAPSLWLYRQYCLVYRGLTAARSSLGFRSTISLNSAPSTTRSNALPKTGNASVATGGCPRCARCIQATRKCGNTVVTVSAEPGSRRKSCGAVAAFDDVRRHAPGADLP